MSLLRKKILFFGSDLISLNTLRIIKQHSNSISIVCPPYKKPRTPLAELHDFVNKN